MSALQKATVYLLGIAFGLALSRSGAADYTFIQEMFLFESFQLYGIIGSAICFTAPALYFLKKHGKAANGDPLRLKAKPLHRGTIIGSLFFGVGWSVTGMCPGPILVNIGEGQLYAIAALVGALTGPGFWGFVPPPSRTLGLPLLPKLRRLAFEAFTNGTYRGTGPWPQLPDPQRLGRNQR